MNAWIACLPYCLAERQLRKLEGTGPYFRWANGGRIKCGLRYWLPYFLVSKRLARRSQRARRAVVVRNSVPSSGIGGDIQAALARIAADRDDSRMTAQDARILVCLHFFYPDLWPLVRRYLENLAPYAWDLLVTYPEGLVPVASLEPIRTFKPNVRLLPCRNAGFDIGPFVESLRQVDLSAYDVVFKLQTKGCRRERIFIYDQVFKRSDWFFNLYDGVLGGRHVHQTVAALKSGSASLAAAANLIVRDPWHKRRFLECFCRARGLPFDDGYRFVAGTCFAVRAEALRPLQGLGLGIGDFADTVRGEFSLAHALERWMCFAAARRLMGVPAKCADYPDEEKAFRSFTAIRMLEDPRFELDPEFFYKVLEMKPVGSYEVVSVRLGDIRRIWSDNRARPLSACAPYRFLCGEETAYDDYCEENERRFGFKMSRERFRALQTSMEEYDPRRMPVVFGEANVILDGQHRACLLLRRFGPDHQIDVLRIRGL